MILDLGCRINAGNHAVQTEATEFDLDTTAEEAWAVVLAFLGTPVKARLTTFPQYHFLDVYFP